MDVPADLRLVEEFLNTLDQRTFRRHGVPFVGGDALATPTALSRWLAEHGLVGTSARASQAHLALAHDLRSVLRDAVGGQRLDEHQLRHANAVLAAFPLRAELAEDGEVRLSGPESAVPAALARLLTTAVRSGADGTWRRLRTCAAPECRWVFYDDSRNGAGRWCSMSSCGNRLKTARYRSRKALDPS